MRLPAIILLTFASLATASGLEWKTTHLDLKAGPLQPTAEAWFDFTNPSSRAVTITGLDTSCDCLEATASDRLVAPGATGRIHARFNLADRYGTLRRTIIVSTDEGTAPATLTVQLEIPEAATLEPRSVEWPLGSPPAERIVELVIAEGIEIAIQSVHATSDAFITRLETVAAGRHYRLHVTPRSTASVANAAFRLYGKTPAGREVVLSAYGNVR